MDCKTARLLLHFARPLSTELEASEAEALHGHLADCSDCGPLAQAERLADDRIGQALRSVPIPDGLRGRLMARLAAERDAHHWRWLRWGSGAAAALVLAVVLAWTWRSTHLDTIDLERVCNVAVEQQGAAPETVLAAFEKKGVRTVVPRDFDYRFLAFYGLVEFQGKTVPQLVFLKDGARARVLILSGQQFNLESLKQLIDQPADSGECTVKVLLDPEHPRFAYLVIYSGGPQMWFLSEPPQPST